jgi:cytochrome c biogenesis factor
MTPPIYTIAGVWGNFEGSMLPWVSNPAQVRQRLRPAE